MIDRARGVIDDANVANEAASAVPAAERVRRLLLDRIATGTLTPGDRLVDAALAEECQASRNTVRDALKLLEADGLVVNRRHTGSWVRSLTVDDVRDIYGARRILERAGIAASPDAPAERRLKVLDAADATLASVERGEWSRVGSLSLQFHRNLVALTGVERLIAFFDVLRAQLRLAFAVMDDEELFQRQWAMRDLEIARAVVGERPDRASQLLSSYLADSEAQVVDALRGHSAGLEHHA